MSLGKTLLLPLDDLLSVMPEYLNPDVSRSGLDRRLRRHGLGSLRALGPSRHGPRTSRSRPMRPATDLSA